MAQDNVQEIRWQDNEQAPMDALEALRKKAWEVQEELRHLSSTADLLSDVKFLDLSSNGEAGLVFCLENLADRMEALGDKLQEACKVSREHQ
ncbi:hypothetical protein [Trichloromonas sp.]|uniref:hypothetical protein n=1 Tax=Trichloromonas sp. TaxID=3069249 RepID=UPI002A4515E4|nr:hypothetical protein [Trichloromonas sp.]